MKQVATILGILAVILLVILSAGCTGTQNTDIEKQPSVVITPSVPEPSATQKALSHEDEVKSVASTISTELEQIYAIIPQLKANGWNAEAKLLENKLSKLETSYSSFFEESTTYANTNLETVTALEAEIREIYNDAVVVFKDSETLNLR